MRTLGARLTLYYALAATFSAALLFIAGYGLLQTRLLHDLDELNEAEFAQLKVRLGADYSALPPHEINQRIRDSADAASALFLIDVDEPRTGMVFTSRNLNRQPIPDVKGLHRYNAFMPGKGEIRVGEFVTQRFDVAIATPMAQARESLRSYGEVCVGLVTIMLLVSAGIGAALSHVLLRPLNFIRETANRISSDNLSARIPVPLRRDELAELAELLNRMFDRLESSFDQIKRFAAEASHELKTPLSLIRLHGERLLENENLAPQAVEAVQVQLEEVATLSRIIDEMLLLSRAEAHAIPLDLEPQNPGPMLRGIEQDGQALAEHTSRRFTLIEEGSGIVAFEERWLRQVWLNLLSNALKATPPGGLVVLRARFVGAVWEVVVEDEGPGLSAEQLPRIFERFTQFGRGEGGGSGLGLAIARSIVALHSGSIVARNRNDRTGLAVTVTLPAR